MASAWATWAMPMTPEIFFGEAWPVTSRPMNPSVSRACLRVSASACAQRPRPGRTSASAISAAGATPSRQDLCCPRSRPAAGVSAIASVRPSRSNRIFSGSPGARGLQRRRDLGRSARSAARRWRGCGRPAQLALRRPNRATPARPRPAVRAGRGLEADRAQRVGLVEVGGEPVQAQHVFAHARPCGVLAPRSSAARGRSRPAPAA